MVHRESPGDHAAERKAQNGRAINRQFVEKCRQLARKDRQTMRLAGLGCAAMAGEIIGHDPIGIGERGNLPAPHRMREP